jgi:hypothetical protein
VANRRRPVIDDTTCSPAADIARQVQLIRRHFQQLPTPHGNTRLSDENTFIILAAAFHEPLAQSHRCIEQLAKTDQLSKQLNGVRAPRSTLSDAIKRFRVGALRPLTRLLLRKLPGLGRVDPDLALVTQQVVAGDGSLFRMAGEVAWALSRKKNKAGKVDSQARLDLLVDVRRWTLADFRVSGKADGPEPAVMAQMLQPGAIHLLDRAYYPFAFLSQLLAGGSHMVVRLKKDLVFRTQTTQPLSEKDTQSSVQRDELGLLGVEDGCKDSPPQQTLRLVTVWDEQNQKPVRLLTDLLDLPAWVIGHLYRCRWIIELFLRWLKVTVGFQHLLSESANGITLQFYVAMICTMLIHLRTGLPVSKYSLLAMGFAAQGRGDFDGQIEVLLKRERERMLERARLARKKALKNKPA